MALFPMLVFHFMGQRRGQKGVTRFSLALKTFPSLSSGLCFGFPLSVTNDFPGRITLPLCQVPPSPVACEIQPLSRNSLIFSTIFLLPSFFFFFFLLPSLMELQNFTRHCFFSPAYYDSSVLLRAGLSSAAPFPPQAPGGKWGSRISPSRTHQHQLPEASHMCYIYIHCEWLEEHHNTVTQPK